MTSPTPASRRLGGHHAPANALWRTSRIAALGTLLLVPIPAALRGARAEDGAALVIATYGGAYSQSQQIAYFEPFTQTTGTKITMEIYDGTLGAIKDKISASPSVYDIVDLSADALTTLCRDGLLEPIESSMLDPAAGAPSAADDFLAGGLPTCGMASVAWSTTIAFNRQAFDKAQPAKIADLLDTKRFPGKRALPQGARYTLELALLADGVEPENVYGELATPAGADRAFKALDKIKADILWWDKAQDPIAWLMEKKVVMAAAYSGRTFRSAVGAPQIDLLWDGQVYDLDFWAIPKTAANKEAAKRFVAFAMEPARLAVQAQLIAYGPMRKSAIALVGKNPAIDVEMARYLPTTPDHLKKALRFDAGWWSEHGDELANRFQVWREQAATAADTPPGPLQGTPPSQPQ
jgi:putative spermidine/putrescine transport system substrate-binding protein